MKQLIAWWIRVIGSLPEDKLGGDLPFEPGEMAGLIRSGKREDMRKLAAGLSRPSGARHRSERSE